MTASEILINRYGMDPEKAELYASMAEQELREYLNYGADDSLARFASTVATAAALMFKKDEAVAAGSASGSVPVKSESFSEGGVSVSKTYLAGGDLYSYYDDAVARAFDGVKRYRRARVPATISAVGGVIANGTNG